MLRGLRTFLVKELKELARDPKILIGMIIVPVVLFPIMGSIMSYAMTTAVEQTVKATLVVINNDGGEWSHAFLQFLQNAGVKVIVEDNVDLEGRVVELISKYNTTQILEIPLGFSQNVTAHLTNPNIKATLRFYSVFQGTSIFEGTGSSIVDALVSQFNRSIAPDVLYTEKSTIIKGEVKRGLDPSMISGIMAMQSFTMPLVVIILLSSSMQIAATTVASEKEEKTLETLLATPVDRLAILWGKLFSSIIIAAIGAVAYMIGVTYYFGSLTGNITAAVEAAGVSLDLASLGLAMTPLGYLLLGISLFVTIVAALSLAVIISAFAEDVRSAQSLVGYIYIPIYFPAFALMFIDINTLPLAAKILLYAIPFSHPAIASRAVTMGDYWTAALGIIYVSAFTLIVTYLASRMFATEKILTAKIRFKKAKRGKKPEEEP
ncbi:MAG: ABC transporter permease [Candidatus Bathyarchaeia archaeon]